MLVGAGVVVVVVGADVVVVVVVVVDVQLGLPPMFHVPEGHGAQDERPKRWGAVVNVPAGHGKQVSTMLTNSTNPPAAQGGP
jgi:hypothetical protein